MNNTQETMQAILQDNLVEFEVSKNVTVKAKVPYNEATSLLMSRIEELEKKRDMDFRRITELERELKEIKKNNILITEESLFELWDNEYDEAWNTL